MAVVMSRDEKNADDHSADVIEGRPDFADKDFSKTVAKKHPPYVFSIRGASCLVHKVIRVELHWWRVGRGGHSLVKLNRPVMTAITSCAMYFRLKPTVSRTCHVPSPDALLCGRCHGDVATFGKHGPATKLGIKRKDAHVKLGCVIAGY